LTGPNILWRSDTDGGGEQDPKLWDESRRAKIAHDLIDEGEEPETAM
jgi:hypothetical protein